MPTHNFNPTIHHRHSIRLRGYDYSQAGLYFATVCVQNRECLFGKIIDGEMIFNEYGQFATQCLLEIPQHFPNAVLHEFIIMPNHIHCIIELTKNNGGTAPPVGAKNLSPLPSQRLTPGTSRTIGSIIRGFKIGVTKQIGYSIWQRNYYEHIIRNEQSYTRIADYIINNPANWEKDKFYVK